MCFLRLCKSPTFLQIPQRNDISILIYMKKEGKREKGICSHLTRERSSHYISLETSGPSLKQLMSMPCPDLPYIFCQLLQVPLLMTHTVTFSERTPLRDGNPSPRDAEELCNHPPHINPEQLRANDWQKTSSLPQDGADFGTICLPELPSRSGCG